MNRRTRMLDVAAVLVAVAGSQTNVLSNMRRRQRRNAPSQSDDGRPAAFLQSGAARA